MVNISELHNPRVEEQDLSSGDLELTPDVGESFEILARGISGGGDEETIRESVGEELMLHYPADEGDDEIFSDGTVQDLNMDFLGWMRSQGLPAPTLKVPEDTTYVLNNPDDSGTAFILYEQGGANMVSETEPGGPETKERTFITSSQVSKSVSASATETKELDVSINPPEMQDWPWEEDVPSNREYDLQAFFVGLDNSTSGITFEGFRFITEEQRPLAQNGDFVDPLFAEYPDLQTPQYGYIFPEQPQFTPGDDLTVEVSVTDTSAGSNTAIVNAAMVTRRRQV